MEMYGTMGNVENKKKWKATSAAEKNKKKHQFRKHQGAISTRDMPRSRIGKRLADVEGGWLHKLMTDLLGDERDQSSLDHWSYAYHDA